MARRIRIKINSTIKKRTILKASDYCLDISKLILAGVVIAGVVDLNTDKTMLLFAGAFAVVAIGLLGFFFYILGNQSNCKVNEYDSLFVSFLRYGGSSRPPLVGPRTLQVGQEE